MMLMVITLAVRRPCRRKLTRTSADMQSRRCGLPSSIGYGLTTSTRDAKPAERHEAWAEAGLFPFCQSGSCATSREVVCLAAGLDPDALREKAMALAECHWFPLVASG
jgi:hypothetical protein